MAQFKAAQQQQIVKIAVLPLLLTTVACLLFNASSASAKVPSANDYVERIVGTSTSQSLHGFNDYLVDFAHLKGFVFIDKDHRLQKDPKALSNHFSVTAPLTLFPSPFPKELYEEARALQPLMARVHLRVSLDYPFLREAMQGVANAEKPEERFIGKLVEIMGAVHGNRRQSGMTLLLQRSDYLSHLEEAGALQQQHGGGGGSKKTISIKQIEVSTGVHGGQGLNPNPVHARVLGKVRYLREGLRQPVPEWFQQLELARDDSVQGQAMAFYETWLAFTTMHQDARAVILLINPSRRSAHSHFQEHKWVLFKLEDIARERGKGRPRVEQITFEECSTRLTFDEHHHMFLDGGKRVAIIFHGGYLPKHFAGKDDWRIRLQMEQSMAVMVPNVFTFLAGTKKIQQVLAEPGRLERFFPELKAAENPRASAAARAEAVKLKKGLDKLRATFIQMWGLGKNTEEEAQLLKAVIAQPDDYVMKENLEGGNGNLFGQKLATRLEELRGDHEKRSLYILQKIIRPFTAKNAISPVPPALESGLSIVDVNSELSIFGALLAHTDNQRVERKIVFNNVDGYLVRTKVLSNVMCNLCGGMGGADSLVLFPQADFVESNNAKTEEEVAAPVQLDIDALADDEA